MSGIIPVAENLSSPNAHDIRKSGYCNSHLTDEEAEAQMMQITCRKSHKMARKRGDKDSNSHAPKAGFPSSPTVVFGAE